MYLKFLLVLCVFVKAVENCESDSDCLSFSTCIDKVCVHKGLIPLETLEYIGSAVMVVVSIVANAGGVGGSSMTISLMLLFFNFDAHNSVALTQVFIFAGTTTVTILKFKDRHPTRDRPLIYYDVLMQITSPILVGVSIGVMVNPAFPSWLILATLTIVVFFLVFDVLKRGIKMYKRETELNKVIGKSPDEKSVKTALKSAVSGVKSAEIMVNYEAKVVPENKAEVFVEPLSDLAEERKEFYHSDEEPVGSMENVAENDGKNNKGIVRVRNGEEENERNNAEKSYELSNNDENMERLSADVAEMPELVRRMTTIYQEEKKIISLGPLLYFIVLSGSSIAFSLMKGSKLSKSLVGIESCSGNYFGLMIGYFSFMLVLNILASIFLIRKTQVCEKMNYQFDDGDIKWNYSKCIGVSITAIFAGIVVGLLGMGGGNLIGPMLLSLGVRPEISTVSSSFTIFISSGIASAQYFIAGVIDFYYAAWFFGVSSCGSLIGILVLRKYAIRKQRVSLLILCLAIILLISLVIIPTVAILTLIKQQEQGNFQLGFLSLC